MTIDQRIAKILLIDNSDLEANGGQQSRKTMTINARVISLAKDPFWSLPIKQAD